MSQRKCPFRGEPMETRPLTVKVDGLPVDIEETTRFLRSQCAQEATGESNRIQLEGGSNGDRMQTSRRVRD